MLNNFRPADLKYKPNESDPESLKKFINHFNDFVESVEGLSGFSSRKIRVNLKHDQTVTIPTDREVMAVLPLMGRVDRLNSVELFLREVRVKASLASEIALSSGKHKEISVTGSTFREGDAIGGPRNIVKSAVTATAFDGQDISTEQPMLNAFRGSRVHLYSEEAELLLIYRR